MMPSVVVAVECPGMFRFLDCVCSLHTLLRSQARLESIRYSTSPPTPPTPTHTRMLTQSVILFEHAPLLGTVGKCSEVLSTHGTPQTAPGLPVRCPPPPLPPARWLPPQLPCRPIAQL